MRKVEKRTNLPIYSINLQKCLIVFSYLCIVNKLNL